jgi:hypothetical protein
MRSAWRRVEIRSGSVWMTVRRARAVGSCKPVQGGTPWHGRHRGGGKPPPVRLSRSDASRGVLVRPNLHGASDGLRLDPAGARRSGATGNPSQAALRSWSRQFEACFRAAAENRPPAGARAGRFPWWEGSWARSAGPRSKAHGAVASRRCSACLERERQALRRPWQSADMAPVLPSPRARRGTCPMLRRRRRRLRRRLIPLTHHRPTLRLRAPIPRPTPTPRHRATRASRALAEQRSGPQAMMRAAGLEPATSRVWWMQSAAGLDGTL